MSLHKKRREAFKLFGNNLVNSLNLSAISGTDTEIQGKTSEKNFHKWLNQQLPKRFQGMNGTVLSVNNPPCTERDCVIFDVGECPAFRQTGEQPDMFPVEGIIGSIEINTGKAGTTYTKLLHDCEKLSETGRLIKDRLSPTSEAIKLKPYTGARALTLQTDIAVLQQPYPRTPFLYLFVENLQGNLDELTKRIIEHNKTVSVSISVSGAFVLNKGIILHINPDEGWNQTRLQGFPLAYMEAEPWEILLKLMSAIWHRVSRETLIPDLGPYYADKQYFMSYEKPRCKVIDDKDYLSQSEPGLATVRG